jgi:hypothetical protein
MALHHYQDCYAEFEALVSCRRNHVTVRSGPDYRRGDRIHITDIPSAEELWRTITQVTPAPFPGLEDFTSLGLLHPEVSLLTQFALTNERGQTSVFWIGDPRDLQIGSYLRLFDNESDWRIDSRWTSLTPNNVPEKARIGFVKEIF